MRLMTVLLLLSSLGLAACGQALDDFVKTRPNPGIPIPSTDNTQPFLKMSPGSLRAQGTNVSMKATITPTNTRLNGTNVSAKVGVQKSR